MQTTRTTMTAALLAVACCTPAVASRTTAPVATRGDESVPGVQASQPSPKPIGQMAHVPEAAFQMGSQLGDADEAPVHTVHVAAFDLDVTEVTVAEYASCVRAGGCAPAAAVVQWPGITSDDQQLSKDICNTNRSDRQDHAINCVDWSMADAYCRWAGKRLPTEEEWEYAACAGDCGAAVRAMGGSAALRNASRWPFTSQVATSWPGPFGIYDMAGNVWEWTASAYCPYDHPGCSDPRRVVRGGSWSMVNFLFVRLTDRSPSDPSTRNTNLGFRCARSVTR